MRLIDADSLLIDLNNFVSYETAYEYEEVKECVLSAPTIEAEPTRHGRWEYQDIWGGIFKCSNCDAIMTFAYHFCPYCGSKMDEEAEE